MKRLGFTCLIVLSTCMNWVYADTCDVWKIMINDKVVVQSNQFLITGGTPMELVLEGYREIDSVKIFYWSDTGGDQTPWRLDFFSMGGQFITGIQNIIDMNTLEMRYRGFVACYVNYLRDAIYMVEMAHLYCVFYPAAGQKNLYEGKKIAIIKFK